MSEHDLQARLICHHTRESIEAHLRIVFAAMAVSHCIETHTSWCIQKFVRTARRYRTVHIKAGRQTLAAADQLLDGLHDALTRIGSTGVHQPGPTRGNQPGRAYGHSGTTYFNSSTTQPGYSYYTTCTSVLTVADITGIPAGKGLHYGPRGWDPITLNPWWQQRQTLGI